MENSAGTTMKCSTATTAHVTDSDSGNVTCARVGEQEKTKTKVTTNTHHTKGNNLNDLSNWETVAHHVTFAFKPNFAELLKQWRFRNEGCQPSAEATLTVVSSQAESESEHRNNFKENSSSTYHHSSSMSEQSHYSTLSSSTSSVMSSTTASAIDDAPSKTKTKKKRSTRRGGSKSSMIDQTGIEFLQLLQAHRLIGMPLRFQIDGIATNSELQVLKVSLVPLAEQPVKISRDAFELLNMICPFRENVFGTRVNNSTSYDTPSMGTDPSMGTGPSMGTLNDGGDIVHQRDFHITVLKSEGVESRLSNELLSRTSKTAMADTLSRHPALRTLWIDTVFGIAVSHRVLYLTDEIDFKYFLRDQLRQERDEIENSREVAKKKMKQQLENKKFNADSFDWPTL
eukprot:g1562.t1